MSDRGEQEPHQTVRRMEQVAKELFRDADTRERAQPDSGGAKASWWDRVRKRIFWARKTDHLGVVSWSWWLGGYHASA